MWTASPQAIRPRRGERGRAEACGSAGLRGAFFPARQRAAVTVTRRRATIIASADDDYWAAFGLPFFRPIAIFPISFETPRVAPDSHPTDAEPRAAFGRTVRRRANSEMRIPPRGPADTSRAPQRLPLLGGKVAPILGLGTRGYWIGALLSGGKAGRRYPAAADRASCPFAALWITPPGSNPGGAKLTVVAIVTPAPPATAQGY
jgi:hypothetical protein